MPPTTAHGWPGPTPPESDYPVTIAVDGTLVRLTFPAKLPGSPGTVRITPGNARRFAQALIDAAARADGY